METLARNAAKRSKGVVTALDNVIKDVCDSMVDAQFAGFASENVALKSLLANPSVTDALQKLAALQDREHELDLPATIGVA